MQCPKCRSRNVRSCEAAYLMGSRWGYRQIRSELAQRCAPPVRRGSTELEGLSILFLWWCFSVALHVAVRSLHYPDWQEEHIGSTYLDFLWIQLTMFDLIWYGFFVGYALVISMYFLDRNRYMRERQKWEKEWVCIQCATIFSE